MDAQSRMTGVCPCCGCGALLAPIWPEGEADPACCCGVGFCGFFAMFCSVCRVAAPMPVFTARRPEVSRPFSAGLRRASSRLRRSMHPKSKLQPGFPHKPRLSGRLRDKVDTVCPIGAGGATGGPCQGWRHDSSCATACCVAADDDGLEHAQRRLFTAGRTALYVPCAASLYLGAT
jgi:hypothetical protein